MRTRAPTVLVFIFIAAFFGITFAQPKSVINVAYQEHMNTLDPAIGWDLNNWPVIHVLFVSLLTYDANANLEPWAATAMPEVSDNEQTYTFHIRPGIKFTDGEEANAEAFRYAIERVLNPKTQSPQGGMGGWFGVLEGAQAFVDGNADHVSGIRVEGPYTLQFRLSEPNRTFLNALATPFSAAVPINAVEKAGADFGHTVVTDGPFKVASWTPGQRLVLVKNPDYFDAATAAKVDQINFELGLTPQVALLRAERGQIDVVGSDLPSSQFLSVVSNPKYKSYLHHAVQMGVNYVYMNTQMAPFDNRTVREAVNYAIDKTQVIKLLNGRGEPADQVLPPDMPGYDESVQPVPYDPSKAKQLLAQAGYPDGFATTLLTETSSPWDKLAQIVQQQLAEVGIKVTIKALPHGEYIDTMTTPGKSAIGVAGWYMDYPDPSDFLDVLFNSANIQPGSFALAEYKNPAFDKIMSEARVLPLDQAIPMYQKAQKMLLADYPWVPLYFPVQYKFVNPRVQGFSIDPVWTFDWNKLAVE